VNLRCCLFSVLKIHRTDCEHCNVRETRGDEIRKWLEELNWPARPRSFNRGIMERQWRWSSGEVAADLPISLTVLQQRKID
jgi:hypothetical protein